MTHSDRCKSANRFGDGFDCICGYYDRPQPAQPEIECVMCSTKFSAPVACRDCTEYAQDSVGVPTARELEIRAICRELEAAWLRSPEQRLGQLVKNLATSQSPLWNIRDSRWLKLLKAWAR